MTFSQYGALKGDGPRCKHLLLVVVSWICCTAPTPFYCPPLAIPWTTSTRGVCRSPSIECAPRSPIARDLEGERDCARQTVGTDESRPFAERPAATPTPTCSLRACQASMNFPPQSR